MKAYDLLLEVEGVGSEKAHALLSEFGTGRKVARAACSSFIQIADLDGFSRESAKDLFHKLTDANVYCDLLGGTDAVPARMNIHV